LMGVTIPGYLKFVPTRRETPVPIRFELLAQDGSRLILPYVDFRVAKSGLGEVTLSNEHQNIPLHFELVVPLFENRPSSTQAKLASPGANVLDTKEALAF